MSKKNKLSTRRNRHTHMKNEAKKLKIKAVKRELKRKVKHAADAAADALAKVMEATTSKPESPNPDGGQAKLLADTKEFQDMINHKDDNLGPEAGLGGKPIFNKEKFKRRMPRLRKGAVVRGIKIVDAETRKQVEAILAEERESKMDSD